MKWVGMCFVFAGCVGLGLYYRLREICRLRNLYELLKAVTFLSGEIDAMHTPLPDALFHSAGRVRGTASSFFRAVSDGLEEGEGEFCDVWKKKLQETVSSVQLRGEDCRELEEFGETLGYLDAEMQLRCIELYRKRLIYSINGMERENEKKCRLYPALGTIAGVFLCILCL